MQFRDLGRLYTLSQIKGMSYGCLMSGWFRAHFLLLSITIEGVKGYLWAKIKWIQAFDGKVNYQNEHYHTGLVF